MGYYIDNDGEYYKGDKASPADIEVTERPSVSHTWTGSEWVFNLDIYKELKINDLDLVYQNWFKFKKTMSPQNIRDSYWDTFDAINESTTIEEVDTAYDDNRTEVLGL